MGLDKFGDEYKPEGVEGEQIKEQIKEMEKNFLEEEVEKRQQQLFSVYEGIKSVYDEWIKLEPTNDKKTDLIKHLSSINEFIIKVISDMTRYYERYENIYKKLAEKDETYLHHLTVVSTLSILYSNEIINKAGTNIWTKQRQAEDLCRKMVEKDKSQNNLRRLVITLKNSGDLHLYRNEDKQALEKYEEAQNVYRELDEEYKKSISGIMRETGLRIVQTTIIVDDELT